MAKCHHCSLLTLTNPKCAKSPSRWTFKLLQSFAFRQCCLNNLEVLHGVHDHVYAEGKLLKVKFLLCQRVNASLIWTDVAKLLSAGAMTISASSDVGGRRPVLPGPPTEFCCQIFAIFDKFLKINVVLICIFLMIDVEYIFICLKTKYVSCNAYPYIVF